MYNNPSDDLSTQMFRDRSPKAFDWLLFALSIAPIKCITELVRCRSMELAADAITFAVSTGYVRF